MKDRNGNEFKVGDILRSYSAPLLRAVCESIQDDTAELRVVYSEARRFRINQDSMCESHWEKESGIENGSTI